MKVLMVNKFLYPNGGSETYIFQLGRELERQGDTVQYFGMEDDRNIVGNNLGSYTANMNFHSGKLSKLLYPFRIIYSGEARRKIRKVLKDFKPDVVHLNNFNFQLTPSILYEIRKFEKQSHHSIKILYTAHDYQLVCPNHMMKCPTSGNNCDKCINGEFGNCIKGKCIHGSTVKSILGAMEGWIYRKLKTYRKIDVVICPSRFMQEQLEQHPDLRGKTVMMHNFTTIDSGQADHPAEKEKYLLYFGRYSEEKGMKTLLHVCKTLQNIPFVFAGKGPYEEQINHAANIKNEGFLTEDKLRTVIEKARFSIYPSEWYENCPFSVMESIQYGTPVIGADIGGIPELIENGKTGIIFESGNEKELEQIIRQLWDNPEKMEEYEKNCRDAGFASVEKYARAIRQYYENRY